MKNLLGTWVDGRKGDVVPVSDRGLLYGDGVFETVLARQGRPRFLALHLARLAEGCRRLRLTGPSEQALLEDLRLALAHAPPLAVLRITITRGDGIRRGYAPQGSETARRIVSAFACEPLMGLEQGVALHVATTIAADNPALAGIKHLNRLENVLAAREARDAGAFDALMKAADGRLVSGAMSNLFLVSEGTLLTPRVDRAGVAGVMRAVVLRECGQLGYAASERDLTLGDLRRADGAFVTNARIGVVPVRRVGEHALPMNAVAGRIAAHVESLDA